MKKVILGGIAATALSLAAGAASAQSMADKMGGMMQCTAACTTSYFQCLGNAQQLTSDPMMAGKQVMTNFEASAACGQEAMACQKGCN